LVRANPALEGTPSDFVRKAMSIVAPPSFSTVCPLLRVALILDALISLFESHENLVRNYKESTCANFTQKYLLGAE
jgi:hypothetical protein